VDVQVFVAVVSTANGRQRIKPSTLQVSESVVMNNAKVFIRCPTLVVLSTATKT